MNKELTDHELNDLLEEMEATLHKNIGGFEGRVSIYFPSNKIYPPTIIYRLSYNWKYYDLTCEQYYTFISWLHQRMNKNA